MNKSQVKLHHALTILIESTPINKLSIAMLCRLANINRSTFYIYYSSIQDLIDELLLDIFRDIEHFIHSYQNEKFYYQLLVYFEDNAFLSTLMKTNQDYILEEKIIHYFQIMNDSSSPFIQLYHSYACFHMIKHFIKNKVFNKQEYAFLLYQTILSSNN